MKLELSKDEVKTILLAWAKQSFGEKFISVEIGDRYSSYGSPFVTLSDDKPEAE